MDNQVFKIGQRIAFDKEIELQGMNGDRKVVKKDDEGYIDSKGRINITSGELRGKIIPDKLKVKGYDTVGISNVIFKQIREFISEDFEDDYDTIIEEIQETLEDIF